VLPSLESLRCFVAAAKTLNFRKASRSVAMTPAALGQRIAALEGQLDTQLFVRTTRSVMLTDAGALLVPKAEAALFAAASCLSQTAGAQGAVNLSVGTRHELGMSWVLPTMHKMEQADGRFLTHLYFGSGPDLVARVRSMEIDCAIASTRFDDRKIGSLPLHEERYVFVGAAQLLKRTPLAVAADAEQHTLLDINDGLPLFRYFQDGTRQAKGSSRTQSKKHKESAAPVLRFARTRMLGTIDAIRSMALLGEGIAVLPEYFVAKDLAARTLVRILPEVTPAGDWFRLLFRIDDPRQSLMQDIATFLRQAPLR
jgi:LysR family transcriptional regulator, glycine cleavage system transcriptional activator